MTEASAQATGEAGGAGPVALTDGIHLVVDALKLNEVKTIYGVVGIPVTDLAEKLMRTHTERTTQFYRKEFVAANRTPAG